MPLFPLPSGAISYFPEITKYFAIVWLQNIIFKLKAINKNAFSAPFEHTFVSLAAIVPPFLQRGMRFVFRSFHDPNVHG